MIAANKRALKANLTQGVLGIQQNLIQLYSSNLSAVATQAALIAGFAFTACSNVILDTGSGDAVMQLSLGYFYFVCFTICLISSLFVLSQATIVVMFGPSMSLKGDKEDAVKIAADKMRVEQGFIFQIGIVSITALFLGACIQSWSLYPRGIASITTFCYIVGYVMLIFQGVRSYRDFVSSSDVTVGMNMSVAESKGLLNVNDSDTLAQAYEMIQSRCQGTIWRRCPIEDGGNFVKSFAVLQKGVLDLYKSEKDYLNNCNPIIKKPYKLPQYVLETDPKKFDRRMTSVRNTFKSAIFGTGQFQVGEMLTSEHDLTYASQNYKFALVPKINSELIAMDVLEFICHDDNSYKQWTFLLSHVINAFAEIEANPSVADMFKTNASDVEYIIKASNVVTAGQTSN